ncbi:MAG TPA: Rne/Rng family ribonuclease, partial [Candidatus Kapabacteria bacterium]|nr:Rne/Rng family ribonuclease [Candidatus Kapabacteria bacterium]
KSKIGTKKKSLIQKVKSHTKKSGAVDINLEPGQLILVQVIREAYHSKGMKVTTKLGIPGRYTVLLPFDNVLGVSKKIASYVARRRLRQLAKSILPEGYGGIIRTAAQGKSEDELRRDWNYLLDIWKMVHQKAESLKKPGLVYQDLGLATSVVRDLFDQDVKLLAVDSKKLHKEIINYLKVNSPHLIEKVELYNGDRPIFEAFGIEKELAKTFRRTVNLPSGGDVVFDHTEAMHVIDVNSGRSNETDQEKNAFKTNIEAANEIARQIRLRDLSGMIIIDFIDMQQENNKKKLFQEMTRLLAKDRAKTVCFPLTQLGLMQITRQRINQNLEEKTSEICHVCNGTGRIISKAVLINTIERWLKNFRKNSREFKLILQVHPNIATYITEGTFSIISRLMLKYFVKITVQQSDTIGIDKFRFISVRKDKDITNEFM